MTEGKFWDKFRENHNLKYYYATKKIKKEIKEKTQKQKDKETFEDIGNTTIIPTSVIQSIKKIH